MTRPAPRIRDAGDSALLLEFEPVIDAAVNARAVAVAAQVRAARIPGVRDVVSTYQAVAVFFDPLTTDYAKVVEALSAAPMPGAGVDGRRIDIPVAYGGEHGPDLEAVAAWAGLAPEEVVRRHTGAVYRVFMLGFLPGFAYLGAVDSSIAAPRREEPRLSVPAGSVGIAGAQTGIYPQRSPGGWQLIGRTNAAIFDPTRTPASLFAPGDEVRFVDDPERALATPEPSTPRMSAMPAAARRSLTVTSPGLLTTIQDLGRWGRQNVGVPVSGAMDTLSHRVANALVGNPADALTLEATIVGPALRLESEMLVAVAGADFQATVDDEELPLNEARRCRPGSVLRFGECRRGARVYVACDGGFTEPRHRGIRAGERLWLGGAAGAPRSVAVAQAAPSGGARLRVLPGPQEDFFDAAAIDTLQRTRFTITPRSDRMGYRLAGGRIARADAREMISSVALTGGVQVPPSGEPILLMADRQTTGGYPQIATVISADLPLAGQLAPGDWIEFAVCTRREAIDALSAQEAGWRAQV